MAATVKSRSLGVVDQAPQGMLVLSLGPFDANSVDANVFVADKPYRVVSVEEVHSAATAGAATLDLTHASGTAAPNAGADVALSAFDLNATANTVQTATLLPLDAIVEMITGNRLCLNFIGTLTGLAGCHVTVVLIPIPDTLNWISR